ncbi:hypothetical protein IIA95_03045 [Patescibacteria group bacterium]|nr:hypothetical protein [Patescibacteria group bacterium]
MKIDNFSLPHPILRPDGNVKGNFSTHVKVNVKKNEVRIVADMILTNDVLKNFIEEKKVAFGLDISCKYTIYRESFTSFDKKMEILIPAAKLRDTTEVNCFLVAVKDIQNYKNEYREDIYDNRDFNLSKGEILGYSGRDTFEVPKEWEMPEVGGAFFVLDKHSGKEVKYELGSDPILIKIPKKDFQVMHDIKKNERMKAVFYTLYAYPAMLYVLSEIFGERKDMYEHRKWYKRLHEILSSSQFRQLSQNQEESPKIAQMIFQYPLTNSINDIEKVIIGLSEFSE